MFKFNFNAEEDHPQTKVCDGQNAVEWYKSKELEVPADTVELLNRVSRDQIVKVDYNCGVTFSCLSANEVMNKLKENSDNENFLDVLAADKQHSDLIPGKYEGGLKTWECTKDLVIYFMKHIVDKTGKGLKEKRVLDLGCGSGILGIMCLLQGAYVTFQDYVSMWETAGKIANQEVVEAMTIPNIFLNCDDSVRQRIKLFSGDWSSFLELVTSSKDNQNGNTKFDYILTAETIYNPENYKKIIEIIKELLTADGSAFVAAKSHYFGVGGNLREFEGLLQEEGLNCNSCWETTEGVSRGILEIKLKV